jgi:hypothetical protein
MPLLRARRQPPPSVETRPGRLRRWLIPGLGAVTPVGLIVVNIAVFIVKNLAAFRWTITILAFVSGMMLNSWIGLKIYRLLQQRWRDHFLVSEMNQDIVLIGGMAVIIAASFITALFCYLGLANENNLPNPETFLTGLFAIAVPFTLQFIFQRMLGRRRHGGPAGRESDGAFPAAGGPLASRPVPPPPPPPFARRPERSLERRR